METITTISVQSPVHTLKMLVLWNIGLLTWGKATGLRHWRLRIEATAVVSAKQSPLFLTLFNLILAWRSNQIHHKVRDYITYPSPNFSGATVEVWERIGNFTPHFIMDVDPCMLGLKLIRVSKRDNKKQNSPYPTWTKCLEARLCFVQSDSNGFIYVQELQGTQGLKSIVFYLFSLIPVIICTEWIPCWIRPLESGHIYSTFMK